MLARERFADLTERLLHAGVAPRPLKRLILELQMHLSDLVAELREAGLSEADSHAQAAARLGSDEALEAAILERPELRSWARRRPWLVFAVLPLVGVPLQLVLVMSLTMGAYRLSLHVLGATFTHPGAVLWIGAVLVTYALWLAPIATAGIACLLAARRRTPVLWPIAGSLLTACLGSITDARFEWSQAAPHGLFSVGIAVPGNGSAAVRLLTTLVWVLVPYLMIARRNAARHD